MKPNQNSRVKKNSTAGERKQTYLTQTNVNNSVFFQTLEIELQKHINKHLTIFSFTQNFKQF